MNELCNSKGWIKNPDNPPGWFVCLGCPNCHASGADRRMKIGVVDENGRKRPVDEPEENNVTTARVLRPLRRMPLPEAMNGAGDQFPGEDFPAMPEEVAPPETTPRGRAAAKRGGKSAGNDYYMTDPKVIAAVRKLGPIELDPCGACKPVCDEAGEIVAYETITSPVGAERDYSLARGEDGLKQPWRVRLNALWYCNPPYSQTRKWIEKADAERLSSGVLLIAARTGTIAFQAAKARLICFIGARLMFLDPETGAPPTDGKGKPTGAMFDSAVLYYGTREAAFRAAFEPLGKVVKWT